MGQEREGGGGVQSMLAGPSKPIPVERRAIARRTLTVRLPMPPADSRDCRAEQRWREAAGQAMRSMRARVLGPVEIAMLFDEKQRQQRLSALPKPILELLVRYGVVDALSSAIIRKLTLEWGAAAGVVVEIGSANPASRA